MDNSIMLEKECPWAKLCNQPKDKCPLESLSKQMATSQGQDFLTAQRQITSPNLVEANCPTARSIRDNFNFVAAQATAGHFT